MSASPSSWDSCISPCSGVRIAPPLVGSSSNETSVGRPSTNWSFPAHRQLSMTSPQWDMCGGSQSAVSINSSACQKQEENRAPQRLQKKKQKDTKEPAWGLCELLLGGRKSTINPERSGASSETQISHRIATIRRVLVIPRFN